MRLGLVILLLCLMSLADAFKKAGEGGKKMGDKKGEDGKKKGDDGRKKNLGDMEDADGFAELTMEEIMEGEKEWDKVKDNDSGKKKEWKKVSDKLCCSKANFDDRFLRCIDSCYKMTALDVTDKHPFQLCRKELFKSDKPSNSARKDTCHLEEKRDAWRKCVKREQDAIPNIKPKYKESEEEFEKLLENKFRCFVVCSASLKC